MMITDIVKIDKRKSFIYIDYEKAFSLYVGEIRKYDLQIDNDIKQEVYEEIMTEVLPKRCRERAIYILKDSDKTEKVLKDKLIQGGYPLEIVEIVIDDFKEYRYIDDKRYAFNYVKYNINSKSRGRITNELYLKGVSKELIELSFEENEYDEETINYMQLELVKKEFLKKKYNFEEDDRKELNKIIASLMRKGFKYEDIMHIYNEVKSEG